MVKGSYAQCTSLSAAKDLFRIPEFLNLWNMKVTLSMLNSVCFLCDFSDKTSLAGLANFRTSQKV